MTPHWLQVLSIVSLGLAAACALVVLGHILAGHRQQMWIMNIVWVITPLYSGPIGLWAYFRCGTLSGRQAMMQAKEGGAKRKPAAKKPH